MPLGHSTSRQLILECLAQRGFSEGCLRCPSDGGGRVDIVSKGAFKSSGRLDMPALSSKVLKALAAMPVLLVAAIVTAITMWKERMEDDD